MVSRFNSLKILTILVKTNYRQDDVIGYEGEIDVAYEGEVDEKNEPFGLGMKTFPHGETFYGTWVKGKRHGICKFLATFRQGHNTMLTGIETHSFYCNFDPQHDKIVSEFKNHIEFGKRIAFYK